MISKRVFQIDIKCSFQKTIKNVEKNRDVELQPRKKELFSIKTKLSHKHFPSKYLLAIEMTNNVMKKNHELTSLFRSSNIQNESNRY